MQGSSITPTHSNSDDPDPSLSPHTNGTNPSVFELNNKILNLLEEIDLLSEDNSKLKKIIDEKSLEIEQLFQENKQYRIYQEEKENEINREKEKLISCYEKKILDINENIKNSSKIVKDLQMKVQRDINSMHLYEEQIISLGKKNEDLIALSIEKAEELEDQANLIESLKLQLEAFEKTSTIDSVDSRKIKQEETCNDNTSSQIKEIEKKNIMIEKYQRELAEIKGILSTQIEDTKRIQQIYENQISELNSKLKLSDRSEFIRNTCKENVYRIKTSLIGYQYMIDKRIIGSIILKYFDKSSEGKIKLSLLETLCNMLGYTNEERMKLGLCVLNNGAISRRKSVTESNELEELIDELLNFLESI